jgi:uncharacterized membrane protein YphA (DoxX/SURF4 family)
MTRATSEYALPVLRGGLALAYLYFGVSQLLAPADWSFMIPEWLATVVPANTLVLVNGSFEVTAAILLLLGFWVRPVAWLLAAHLAFITISLGFTPIGARDFGLTLATVSLALAGPDAWTLDARRKK